MQFTRHLPHLHAIGRPLFITFRLHDSLPPGRYFREDSIRSGKAFVTMDHLLDRARCGPVYLRMPEVAELVLGSLKQGAASDYTLHSWVLMPNHVHMLITPRTAVSELMRKLKGVTAREANKVLRRTGQPFWQHESYDRLVRNADELRRIESYIVMNPVRAGLAGCPGEYRWSSAWEAG